MKCTDLMIGDWVYCEGQPTPENVTIQTIAEDGVWFNGPHYEGAASYDRIFPIPITPEILEKNGFEKQGFPGWKISTKDYIILWRNDYQDVLDIRSFNLRICSFHESHIMDIRRARFNYVHELQHALRLCGIKKEIVL